MVLNINIVTQFVYAKIAIIWKHSDDEIRNYRDMYDIDQFRTFMDL